MHVWSYLEETEIQTLCGPAECVRRWGAPLDPEETPEEHHSQEHIQMGRRVTAV